MARVSPQDFEKLAHHYHLDTPEQLYRQGSLVVTLWVFMVFLCLLDLISALVFVTSFFPGGQSSGGPALLVLALGLIGLPLCIYGLKNVHKLPFYCRCTEGFLELKAGDQIKVIHALRWDDITSADKERVKGGEHYIMTKHGKEIQIRDTGIWDYCNERVYMRTGNFS